LDPTSPEVQAELARRHKSAATTVVGLFVASILLSVVAFLARPYLIEKPNPPLDAAMRIAVFAIGIGAVVWRRTKLASMRLRDIVGLAGVSGLLQALEKTTIQIAIFAASITLIGFISTFVTGNDGYTYWSSAVAVILLIWDYPLKSTWRLGLQRFTEPPTEAESAESENPINPV
jgi:hypothetical protein